jgi:hypothetical protein
MLMFDTKAMQDILNQVTHELLSVVGKDLDWLPVCYQDIVKHGDNNFT